MRAMSNDPFFNLLLRLSGPTPQPTNWLWDPFHPSTMFCVSVAMFAGVLTTVMYAV
jgi:hypothetical protein